VTGHDAHDATDHATYPASERGTVPATGTGHGATVMVRDTRADVRHDTAAGVPVMRDLDRREVGTLAPLLLGLVLLGFFPMPVLDVINPTVDDILSQVGVTDEPPTVPTADHSADDAASTQGGTE
jgi:hypothetical protein